jgi:transposase InsO family protein
VPALADMGIYVGSESSFYRILKDEKLDAHRGKVRAAGEVRRPDEHVAAGPNQVWSWDITYLKSPVAGLYYYLYMIVDIWSRKIVGWAVHERESSELSRPLILEACLQEGVDTELLVLHSDNAGPMKGATLLATLQNLGIVPSFSRPRACDDNPYSESLFRTVKYRPEYPGKAFASLEAARAWVEWFVGWYNHEHHHSAIRFVTPAQRHSGEEHQILRHRSQVYEEARRSNPNRWSRQTRDWTPIAEVSLNPSKQKQPVAEVKQRQSA